MYFKWCLLTDIYMHVRVYVQCTPTKSKFLTHYLVWVTEEYMNIPVDLRNLGWPWITCLVWFVCMYVCVCACTCTYK